VPSSHDPVDDDGAAWGPELLSFVEAGAFGGLTTAELVDLY
jgi:hypothetical protein